MIGREGALETILGHVQSIEHGTGIVDQYVDAWLGLGDLGADSAHLVKARQVGEMQYMVEAGSLLAEAAHRRFSALGLARHEHDPGTGPRQGQSRDLADAGGAPCHHYGLVPHDPARWWLHARPPRMVPGPLSPGAATLA